MIKKYLNNTDGNFAMMFGIAAMLLLLGAGAAYDLSAMSSQKKVYQSYADIGALAAAGSGKKKKSELKAVAETYIGQNNFSGDPLDISIKLTENERVRVEVAGNYNSKFMSLFGRSKLGVSVSAESPLADSEPVDIALVLDITGSMSGSKIESLKIAAHGLIDELAAFENDAVRIAVIPFRDYVNIGLSRRDEPWLDVDDDSTATGAEVCYERRDSTLVPGSCETYETTCDNDGVEYSCTRTRNCEYTYGDPYEYCYTPTTNYTWRGCVGSRETPWNERAHKGVANIPGLMNIWCGQEIQELTADMSLVRAKIDSLSAYGKTYLPAGLVWGWRAIHPEPPLTEASTVHKQDKSTVLIFMTDGANTRSQNGAYHNGTDIGDANHISKQLCNGINADGVDIYTVAYDFEAADTIDLLTKCASKPSMFYKADDSAELIEAFKEIGANLFRVRISN